MKDKIVAKLNSLIIEIDSLSLILEDQKQDWANTDRLAIDESTFSAFVTATLSFLETVLGKENLYFLRFKQGVRSFEDYKLTLARELLTRIRSDIEDGWLRDFKNLLSAELFSDFLDMAKHLLEEDYKDAAAVIIGSVLEENLRTLCMNNRIDITITDPQTQKVKSKKAETLNTDLCKAQIYNTAVQKAVTSWLAIRNHAAHGEYSQYDPNQVKNLLQNVIDFLAKHL